MLQAAAPSEKTQPDSSVLRRRTKRHRLFPVGVFLNL